MEVLLYFLTSFFSFPSPSHPVQLLFYVHFSLKDFLVFFRNFRILSSVCERSREFVDKKESIFMKRADMYTDELRMSVDKGIDNRGLF